MSSLPLPQPQQQPPQQRVSVEEIEPQRLNDDVGVSGPAATSATSTLTEILSFACTLPDDISVAPDDPDDEGGPNAKPRPKPVQSPSPDILKSLGIVGTITLLGGSSAMIWFSWGKLESSAEVNRPDGAAVGQALNRVMGPLVVAMPKNDYKGAFSSPKASSSKLISQGSSMEEGFGGDGMQNESIASQIAERLAHKLGMAIFVSCSLEDTPSITGCEGSMERHMMRSRAGALAEKEISRILLERKEKQSNP